MTAPSNRIPRRSSEQLSDIKREVGLEPFEIRLEGLEKKGGEYRAWCPWHERDHKGNPSLAVYKGDEGDWRFKCMTRCPEKKGDVFDFVRELEGVSFPEAVQRVSTNAKSVDAPQVLAVPTPEQLKEVLEYLAARGVPEEFAKRYGERLFHPIVHPVLGVAIGFRYDCDPEVVKYRALHPKNGDKFRHAVGHPSDTLLYNIRHAEKELDREFIGGEIWVTESERDCLLMEAQGRIAVSVSSASACVDKNGELKIDPAHLKILDRADFVFVATDQDPAGNKCAEAFERCPDIASRKVRRIAWPYGGQRSKDPKDIGDLFLQNPEAFGDKLEALADEARNRPPKWRQQFSSIGELDNRPVIQLIEGFLTEGNIGIGGLSGHSKTFLALSIAKALTTGRPFLDKFRVPQTTPVLYLCPEVNDRQLYGRVVKFGIPDDPTLFLCRTLSAGPTLALDDPFVLEAVQYMRPVVILDTAIRFSQARDENAASENLWMEKSCRALREAGATAVILLHHSPKYASNEDPTLENTFRGSGDIGALLDIAYCSRKDERFKGEQIKITCVKPRDFEPPKPFNIGLKYVDAETGKVRSFIDECGDLVLTDSAPESQDDTFRRMVRENPRATYEDLRAALKLKGNGQVDKIALRLEYEKVSGEWRPASVQRAFSA